jgi:GTP pyrophosphokinase
MSQNQLIIQNYFGELITLSQEIDQDDSIMLSDFLNVISLKINNIEEEKIKYSSEVSKIILTEMGGSIKTLIATVLYTLFDEAEIKQFNKNKIINPIVFKILKGLFNIPNLKTDKIDKQSEQFIKLLLMITDDVRAILIKLSLELFKLRNLEKFDDSDRKIIVNQSKNLYTPLAHRIGLYKIKTEFEEKTMKFNEEDMYRFIANKLNETKNVRDRYIDTFIKPIDELLKKTGYKYTIKGRPKSIHSIWNKMKNQKVSFEEVYDLFAIRVILKSDLKNEKNICWNVYSIITDIYKPNPKRLRDWISAPKISGYESLHTTVLGPENKWVEVQIRTERMDEIAEKGPAAHWRYKSGKEGGDVDWLSKIREAIENPSDTALDKETDAKTQLYSDEILVFTPEGDLKSLKKDYTVLDFAFSVHSKIGETCSGAIVNGKIQPLSYKLENGDTVKILTNKNKRPNSEWLEIAKGSKTILKIKRALKSILYDRAESGKEIIKEKLERIKVEFSDNTIDLLSEFFNFKTTIEFYHAVGSGTIDISKIKQAFDKKIVNDEIQPINKKETIEHRRVSNTDYLIIDEHISSLDFTLSKCCNPLPGDDIFGFISVNKGTRIHKYSCSNAPDLLKRYPYRVVNAKWKIDDIHASFSANIFINGYDRVGISSEISDIITKEFNLKLQAISFKTVNFNMFDGVVVLKVNNKKQLSDLINRIKMLKSVKSVFQK